MSYILPPVIIVMKAVLEQTLYDLPEAYEG